MCASLCCVSDGYIDSSNVVVEQNSRGEIWSIVNDGKYELNKK